MVIKRESVVINVSVTLIYSSNTETTRNLGFSLNLYRINRGWDAPGLDVLIESETYISKPLFVLLILLLLITGFAFAER